MNYFKGVEEGLECCPTMPHKFDGCVLERVVTVAQEQFN